MKRHGLPETAPARGRLTGARGARAGRRAAVAAAMLAAGLACLAPAVRAAEATYNAICASCHGPGGTGIPGLAPPLAGVLQKHLKSPRATAYFAQLPISGLIGAITVEGQAYNLAMPSQAQLKDEDLAAAINWVLMALNGAPAPVVSPQDIAEARARSPGPADTYKLRRAVLQGG